VLPSLSPSARIFLIEAGLYYLGSAMIMQKRPVIYVSFVLLLTSAAGFTLAPVSAASMQDQGAPPSAGQRPRRDESQGRPLFGKITAITNGTMQLATPDGTNVTVRITDKTEFRKDRQSATLADFKVGDVVFVRGEDGADHTVTAQIIGARSGTGGPEGAGKGPGGGFGELGKDFVAGEVKSIDAPKLTVLRPDNVSQTLELNEETSLRKSRESITMADIQPGDHVVVRGAVQNNVFVPKNVIVFSPEQWKRLQEMAASRSGPGANAPGTAPKENPPQP
jgi:hypothetical protein